MLTAALTRPAVPNRTFSPAALLEFAGEVAAEPTDEAAEPRDELRPEAWLVNDEMTEEAPELRELATLDKVEAAPPDDDPLAETAAHCCCWSCCAVARSEDGQLLWRHERACVWKFWDVHTHVRSVKPLQPALVAA